MLGGVNATLPRRAAPHHTRPWWAQRWLIVLIAALMLIASVQLAQAWRRAWISYRTLLSVRTAAARNMPAELLPLLDRFDIMLIQVPAGPFIIGEDDDLPEMDVDVFWVGATEVTNAQYRFFVDAGGYLDSTLWTQAGWTWRERNAVTEPTCWHRFNFDRPAQPVVCVSWYEANAYAAWLSRETGIDVRLPTEEEWEKAARGTDGRYRTWGEEDPTAARANYAHYLIDLNMGGSAPGTFNMGIRHTTPVGAYPAGSSPYGALDMAGNVWEWTRSPTARGGCWRTSDWALYITRRADLHPSEQDTCLGFRLTVSLR